MFTKQHDPMMIAEQNRTQQGKEGTSTGLTMSVSLGMQTALYTVFMYIVYPHSKEWITERMKNRQWKVDEGLHYIKSMRNDLWSQRRTALV